MSPSAVDPLHPLYPLPQPLPTPPYDKTPPSSPHPSKRRKPNPPTIEPHPLRIKPLGNAFTASSNLRDTSTGNFALLPDELIIQVLGYIDAKSLLVLESTSKGLYAFCRAEELWKDLFVNNPPNSTFTWHGTWRNTYLNLPPAPSGSQLIICPNLYSDALYRPFYCSQIDFSRHTSSIPSSNLIPRLPDLSIDEFNQNWASTPFILTEPVKSWPGYTSWSIPSLLHKYGDTPFRAEAVDWTLRTYGAYMQNNTDESPLYLFDKYFSEKTSMGEEYTIPEVFTQDFFSVLGAARPDRKWMILGPSRSGSSFHKDPNATSAWNAVASGEKYWIMFPNDITPPGVFVSEDQSEVTSPLSIAEWFECFHKEARKVKGVKEGICKRGEVLYVPSGWWHLVVNLSPALAITENFVPRKHLPSVLAFLKHQPQSVSGFDCEKVKDPYGLFVKRMEEEYPEILKEAMKEMDKLSGHQEKQRGKWDDLVEEAKSGGCGFAFDFAVDDGDDNDDNDDNDGNVE